MPTTPVVTPKQQLRPLTEFNNAQILNMIRNEASPEYQRRMPSATQMNMDRQMATLMSSTQLKNEFYSALVNRIGGTYVNTWRWNNPLSVFQRASQAYGDTWQEIAVGMPLAQVYDPDAEYLGADNFRKWKIDVDSLYHRLDFAHFYPATTMIGRSSALSRPKTVWPRSPPRFSPPAIMPPRLTCSRPCVTSSSSMLSSADIGASI